MLEFGPFLLWCFRERTQPISDIDPSLCYLLSSMQKVASKLSKLPPITNSRKCILSSPSLFLFVDLFLTVTASSPLLMICCDFKRQNMEIAPRGSGIYFLITSVTNYSAQHAESVAPVDLFSPLYLIYLEKGLYCLIHHKVHLGTSVHG